MQIYKQKLGLPYFLVNPNALKRIIFMKDRIRQLMLDKAMTQKTLASELCIAEATLSGIFNGRTRPTHLTINAIHERFPEVNISWLMFDEGEMYNTHQQDTGTSASSITPVEDIDVTEQSPSDIHSVSMQETTINRPIDNVTSNVGGSEHCAISGARGTVVSPVPQIQYIEKYIDKPQRKITEIRIFFDDGTYEAFTP